MSLLVDVFPIEFDKEKYPLSAFHIDASNFIEIGGVFAARIRNNLNIPAVWLKSEAILVVPGTTTETQLTDLLKQLWSIQLEGFEHVNGVHQILGWIQTPEAEAQFVAIGILGSADKWFRALLKKYIYRVGVVFSRREAEFKGVIVNDRPALQITVKSPMASNRKISELPFYDPHNLQSVVNLDARCGTTKGVITKVVGILGNQRSKLKNYNPKSYDAAILDSLPDDHPIVQLKTYSNKTYNYPLDVLYLHVEMGNLSPLGLSSTQINDVASWLKIAPDKRKPLIDEIKKGVSEYLNQQSIPIQIGNRYTSDNFSDNFLHPDSLALETRLRFTRGTAIINRDTEMLRTLKEQGIYRYSSRFESNKEIRIAVIDVIPGEAHLSDRRDQLLRVSATLRNFGLTAKSATSAINIDTQNRVEQRNQLVNGLEDLIRSSPDIVLIYLPETDRVLSDSDETSLYNSAKRVCISNGVPSQAIYEDTPSKSWTSKSGRVFYSADDNIILGILGKTGNIPYVLAQPVDYADVIVGLDVSRKKKMKSAGTMSFAALSRIYTNDGALVGYRTSANTAIEGEIIPQYVLEDILPKSEFGGQRVIIHRDGRFVGDELANLYDWSRIIGATFLPIEITKSGNGRMYYEEGNQITQSPKGAVFALNSQEAYITSSPPPEGYNGAFSTSIPLRIMNYSELTLKQAIHSVIALTLLHYGSTRSTRLPVSVHASDKIAGFLSRNITPKATVGDVPFWL